MLVAVSMAKFPVPPDKSEIDEGEIFFPDLWNFIKVFFF